MNDLEVVLIFIIVALIIRLIISVYKNYLYEEILRDLGLEDFIIENLIKGDV